MHTDDRIMRQARETQKRIFRVACDPSRYGLTLKAISIESGIPYSNLGTYARGEAIMSVASMFKLCGIVPNELLSLLLPEGLSIVTQAEGDHDAFASHCVDFLREKEAAHHPASECGREIGPNENRGLTGRRTQLRAVA